MSLIMKNSRFRMYKKKESEVSDFIIISSLNIESLEDNIGKPKDYSKK